MRLSAKFLALSIIYASLYVVLTLAFAPISYGVLNIRLANIMVGIIPIFGWAGVLGQGLGVFLANLGSPLMPWDLLNCIPSAGMAAITILMYKYSKQNRFIAPIGATMYSVVLGVTVGYLLNWAYGVPLELTILYVAAGNIIASVVIGTPVYLGLNLTGIEKQLSGPKSVDEPRVYNKGILIALAIFTTPIVAAIYYYTRPKKKDVERLKKLEEDVSKLKSKGDQ